MCNGSKRRPTQASFNTGNEYQKQDGNFHILLELAASNDLIEFKRAIEEDGLDVEEAGMWYGRRIGSKGMTLEERTPLVVAALFGSKDVLKYILGTGLVDVNKGCGSDGITALHCAAAGGSSSSLEVVKLLLDASADLNSVDANGNHPSDVIHLAGPGLNTRRRTMEIMLKGGSSSDEAYLPDKIETEIQEQLEISTPRSLKDGAEKKEYPVDLTLPDIKNGIYGTDEFRMYTFKIKPCSRAYSHDWTECPFVHPGENARRRDPRKYHYSCVPCPEFRKGSCRQGDACEYSHGIFECWLHPAQYRTRLCKDEASCNRRVCFFAHKLEELRPLYASTGSVVPSPRSYSASGSALDIGSLSPLGLGYPSVLIPPSSTPPMTSSGPSSPLGGWQNQPSTLPPTLQLSGSRLKSTLSARDMELDMEFLERESLRHRQQQFLDEVSGLASPSSWSNGFSTAAFSSSSVDQTGELNRLGGVKPTNLEDIFGSADPAILPQLQGLSLDTLSPQLQSPKGIPIRHNLNQQLRSSYPTCFSSSPVRTSPSSGFDQSGVTAAAALSSRSAAFLKQRSQSFIERSAVYRHTGLSSPVSSAAILPSNVTAWGSPDGKVDWGIQGEELHKLRKSASFGIRSNGSTEATTPVPTNADEPDVSWVHSLVKDASPMKSMPLGSEESQKEQCQLNSAGLDILPSWVEPMYSDQEQLVA
ncbi:hypothetical protein K2173_012296 [Erythroxylum novogranatense]|uniref:C3H1-type domain-containing protein n=1 Tax=Erythroxylum novogranatense TaxID=1862640 RepID=A0AAV8SCQ0_9ROSI|nr:hypothetical protein K2173_012296 [Erythroxylum novogranatense]